MAQLVGSGRSTRWRLTAGVAVAIALVAVLVVVLRAGGDNGRSSSATTTTTATAVSTTVSTTGATTTTSPPTTAEQPLDTASIVFPDPVLDARFTEPVELVRAFAGELLGFVDPVVGVFLAGDSRSGEVEVRPTPTGPVTTVFVRRLAPTDHWWVLGSATAGIDLAEPAALEEVTSPVRLRGTSTAFEGTVAVEVRQDGSTVPIGSGFVTGGATGEMGSFRSDLAFQVPAATHGVVVLSTRSMEVGGTWEAAVVRVRFGETSPCGGRPAPPAPAPDEMSVRVFFTCRVDGAPMPVTRTVVRSTGVLRAALDSLLAGPTDAEREAGLDSWFSPATAGMVRGVELGSDGRAVVDFDDLRPVIPSAGASAGSELLLGQLDATVFAHEAVATVEYRLGGSCDDFFEWLQLGCEVRHRP